MGKFIFEHPDFDDHEQIVFCRDAATGLKAIIAIHSTRLGPALGGTRRWHYACDEAGFVDALRLSKAMSYKNALAGLAYGGGKAVILRQAEAGPAEAKLLHAYGRHIDRLAGSYITAEDVGMRVSDMDEIAQSTPFVRGTSRGHVGDPAPYTARGVFHGIEAGAAHLWGTPDLNGRRVCVQGLGSVGMRLCRLLRGAGADLTVSDIGEQSVADARAEFDAATVAPTSAHSADVDIFAPCALGAILNAGSIPQIQARLVAGSANAQLETPQDGERLQERGILYAPDYAINAGGVIAVAHDGPDFDARRLDADVARIGDTLAQIFARAADEKTPPHRVADILALERLMAAPALAAC